MNMISNIVRAEGDPKVTHTGPSSLKTADRLGRNLGWVGIGLGLTELLAARKITAALGVEGYEALVRAFGVREIASGVLSLSTEKQAGLWVRLAGDGLDIALLTAALGQRNAKRGNVGLALAMVVGVTMLDAIAAEELTRRHARKTGARRSYRDRSGFPNGLAAARGAAIESPAPNS